MDGSRSIPRLSAAIRSTAASVIICLAAGFGLASCPRDLLGYKAVKPANPAAMRSDMRTLMRLISAVRVVEPPRLSHKAKGAPRSTPGWRERYASKHEIVEASRWRSASRPYCPPRTVSVSRPPCAAISQCPYARARGPL